MHFLGEWRSADYGYFSLLLSVYATYRQSFSECKNTKKNPHNGYTATIRPKGHSFFRLRRKRPQLRLKNRAGGGQTKSTAVSRAFVVDFQSLSGREDSNFRPLAPHASALANCATPRGLKSCAKIRLFFHSSHIFFALLRCRHFILLFYNLITKHAERRRKSSAGCMAAAKNGFLCLKK